jgi:hypothetical protein
MASGSSSNNSSSNGGGGGGSGRLGMPLLTHPKEQPRPTAVPLSSKHVMLLLLLLLLQVLLSTGSMLCYSVYRLY